MAATRPEKRKFHYIYKITRFDGKYYIGMHSTDNLDDGYVGSGKQLWYSINYHGLEKHSKEILEFLPDRASLKKREKELVNEECLKDPICMNLKLGGDGGWDHVSKESRRKGGLISCSKLWNDEFFRMRHSKRMSEMMINLHQTRNLSPPNWKGKKHSEESKIKISLARKGKVVGNGKTDKIWISNIESMTNKIIDKNDIIPEGWLRGRNQWNKPIEAKSKREEKILSEIQIAEKYWKEFIDSKAKSIREFYDHCDYPKSRITLISLFKLHIPEYKDKIKRKD